MNLFLKIILLIETVLIGVFILFITGVVDEESVKHQISHLVSTEILGVRENLNARVVLDNEFQDLSRGEKNIEVDLTDEYNNQGDVDSVKDLAEDFKMGSKKKFSRKYKGISELSNQIRLKRKTNLDRFFAQDPNLELVKFTSPNFSKSETAFFLRNSPTTKVYIIVDFVDLVNFEVLYQLRDLGINKIYQLTINDYLNKKQGFFYLPAYKLKKLARQFFVKDIYIIKDYTALGYYQIGIRSDRSKENLSMSIFTPHSKLGKGHEILAIQNTFSFEPRALSDQAIKDKRIARGWRDDFSNREDNELLFQTDIVANKSIYLLSKIKSKVSLNDMLRHNIRYAGKEVRISNYKEQMKAEHPEVYQRYTQFTEKVVSSDYIKNIVRQIELQNKEQRLAGLKERTIGNIWRQLTVILNKDIRYDWSKRKLFFSGNLAYNNIKDMYMTAKELAEKRVGACTERTSLEIAVLRELGIAARTSTRLYHIFTEIYFPEQGWVSTSSTVNEIPLTYSFDEKMGYFVSWTPNHPIKLKWSGFLLPKIVTESSLRRLALGKLINEKNDTN